MFKQVAYDYRFCRIVIMSYGLGRYFLTIEDYVKLWIFGILSERKFSKYFD
jgi:hypothetical protein